MLQSQLFAIAMSSFLYHFFITTTSSISYQLGYQLTLVFSGINVLCIVYEPNKQFAWLLIYKKRLFIDQRFSNLIVIEQKEYSYAL